MGRAAAPGIQLKLEFIHVAGPTFQEVAQRYTNVDFVGERLTFSPEDFARTLAKIAYCAAVYTLGPAPFRGSPIRRVILGADRNIGHWVGSWVREEIIEPKGLHQMRVLASGTDIHVVLRLFAQFGAPEYHIVLGPADPQFVASEAWPWPRPTA